VWFDGKTCARYFHSKAFRIRSSLNSSKSTKCRFLSIIPIVIILFNLFDIQQWDCKKYQLLVSIKKSDEQLHMSFEIICLLYGMCLVVNSFNYDRLMRQFIISDSLIRTILCSNFLKLHYQCTIAIKTIF